MSTGRHTILFCRCVHRELTPRARVDALLTRLQQAGLPVVVVDDLCGTCTATPPAQLPIPADGALTVLACYPRAVRWLLHRAGLAVTPASLSVLNLRTQDDNAVLAALLPGVTAHLDLPGGRSSRDAGVTSMSPPMSQGLAGARPSTPSRDTDAPSPCWIPWFPVIDYDRCVHCRQCVSFCAFGVYADDGGTVAVTQPRNCKDNCPACARICPQQAIIFPKVPDTPINGAEVSEADLAAARSRSQARQQELASGNIHELLARRKLTLRQRSPSPPTPPTP